MRVKLILLVTILVVLAYSQTLKSPLNSAVAFVVGGIIPGTNIMLGVWPMLLIGLVAVVGVMKYISHIRLKFLENTSKTITAEKLVEDFKQANSTEVATKNTSVIAAPHSKSNS